MNSSNNVNHPMQGNLQNNLLKNSSSNTMNKPSNKKVTLILLAAIFIALIATVGTISFLYIDQKNKNDELKEQIEESVPEKRAEKIVDALKKLISIDDTEKVNIQELTSENIEDIKKQDPKFYTNASVGQFLIVLPKTQRVLIYDENANKI